MEKNNKSLYEKFLNFKNNDLYINYKFDKDEINTIKIDLNFTENVFTSKAVTWAKQQVNLYPEIKPIIQILKRYMLNNKLNDPYKGKIFKIY